MLLSNEGLNMTSMPRPNSDSYNFSTLKSNNTTLEKCMLQGVVTKIRIQKNVLNVKQILQVLDQALQRD